MKTEQTEKSIGNDQDDRFKVSGWRKIESALVHGLIVVESLNDPELTERRRDVCWTCPSMDKKNVSCNTCGCFLDEKTKAKTNRVKGGRIEVTHCPEGKWGDKEIADYYNEQKKQLSQ